ncbi:MFS transporter [Schlesneria paludicola]|uniref:MFS transporter n=1 Tax=Schlesneria paludicola TaxID=360056 RepID=UPI000299ECD2|nr:MFS transporter [Schlesneria paludicola]
MPTHTRRLHYAWIIAGVTFFVLLATAGVRSAPSVLIVPLEDEFGWSRATISAAVSINLLLYGLIGPFAAALMERIGVKKTVLISLAVIASGVALTTFMSAPWQLMLLWGVVVGGGTGMTALVLAATIVNRWFVSQRGLVLGVLTASTATGQLVFLPVMAYIVKQYGWRPAALLIAAVLAIVFPLVALFLRDRPSDLGLQPLGGDPESAETSFASTAPATPPIGALSALREGFRSHNFWLLAGSFYVCGASTNGLVGTHLIPACLDVGMPEVRAAGLLAMMGIFDLAGTTASGWMSDRFDNRVLLSWYYGLRGLSLIFLPFALTEGSWGLTLFAVFYGLDWIATVPPTVRLAADSFGRARASIMFGWIVAAHQIGAATAAFGAGAIRSWSGNYERAFLISGALCLMTAAMVLQIRRGPQPTDAPIDTDENDPVPDMNLSLESGQ